MSGSFQQGLKRLVIAGESKCAEVLAVMEADPAEAGAAPKAACLVLATMYTRSLVSE
jgi:hypothetical protein